MDYYQCSLPSLHKEARRRRTIRFGNHDQLCESLSRDDEARSSNATTISTTSPSSTSTSSSPGDTNSPTDENTDADADANTHHPLLNEHITFWTLNTFFPSLQLFFASGKSCTISCPRAPADVIAGLDPELRFRLEGVSREEDGRLVRSLVPDKYARARIREVVGGARVSVAVRAEAGAEGGKAGTMGIVREGHGVVGLRLEGMEGMGFVWARGKGGDGGRVWWDVELGELRNDVPVPVGVAALEGLKAGGERTVVEKGSMISAAGRSNSVIYQSVRFTA